MKLFEFRLIETDVNKTFSNERHEWKIVSADDGKEAIKLIDAFVKTFYPDPERIIVVSGFPAYSFYRGTIQLFVDSFQETSLEKWIGKVFSLNLINDELDIKKRCEVEMLPIPIKDMNSQQKARLLSGLVQGAANDDVTAEGLFHLTYHIIEGGKWV